MSGRNSVRGRNSLGGWPQLVPFGYDLRTPTGVADLERKLCGSCSPAACDWIGGPVGHKRGHSTGVLSPTGNRDAACFRFVVANGPSLHIQGQTVSWKDGIQTLAVFAASSERLVSWDWRPEQEN